VAKLHSATTTIHVCQRVYASCLRLIMCGEGGTGVSLISVEMWIVKSIVAICYACSKDTNLCTCLSASGRALLNLRALANKECFCISLFSFLFFAKLHLSFQLPDGEQSNLLQKFGRNF